MARSTLPMLCFCCAARSGSHDWRGITALLFKNKQTYIVLGLGNPGREYAQTRHNIGFKVVDAFADKHRVNVSKERFNAMIGSCTLDGIKLILAKPQTFMNNSGRSAVELMSWYKLEHNELIVVYDDIDLPVGAIRIRASGSAGTHNGMKSVISLLGYDDFIRIRIGIGKPAHDLIGHVLSAPPYEDKRKLSEACVNAADAIELIIAGELGKAQSRFNYKPPKPLKACRSNRDGEAFERRDDNVNAENRLENDSGGSVTESDSKA